MRTLLLATNTWDLTVDASLNIAVATDPYATAQDVASECRVFRGEEWYNVDNGIPYFEQILGHFPPASLLKAYEVNAALSVPGVVSATCLITGFTHRSLSGQIQITMTNGATAVVSAANLLGFEPWYVNAVSPAAASSITGGP